MGRIIPPSLHREQAAAVAIGDDVVDPAQAANPRLERQGAGGVAVFLFCPQPQPLRADLTQAVIGLTVNKAGIKAMVKKVGLR